MNLKKLKILLFLSITLFFAVNLFYALPANAATGCVWFYLPGSFKKSCPSMSQKIPTPGGCTTPNPSKDSVSGEGRYYECCCEPDSPAAPIESKGNMPKLKMPELQISIPGLIFTKAGAITCTELNGKKTCHIPWIGEYIAGIYKYAIGIVGILAAVVLMIGGVMWIIAGGSATMIGEAKSWITASLTGLVIALCSYVILYQVNPALTVFGPLGISIVTPSVIPAGVPAGSINCNNGRCKSVDQGKCSVEILQPIFGQYAAQASAICNVETSNGANLCNPKPCAYDKTCSIGLFQINMPYHCSKKFPGAFTKLGDCSSVGDSNQLKACYDYFIDPINNISYAYQLFQESGWKLWGSYNNQSNPDANKCGYPEKCF